MSLTETIKAHPVAAGAIVLGTVIIVVIATRQNSSGVNGYEPGVIDPAQGANQVNDAMSGAAFQFAALKVQADAAAEHDASTITLAQIAAGVADNANVLAAQVANFSTTKERDVALGAYDRDVTIVESNNATQSGIAGLAASVQATIARLASETTLGLGKMSAETTQHADMLHAQVTEASIAATTENNRINAAASQHNTDVLSSALVAQAHETATANIATATINKDLVATLSQNQLIATYLMAR